MKYQVLSFKVEIRFGKGKTEVIDVVNLRTAIERQVKVSLDEDFVYVLPLDPITREVVECNICGGIEVDSTKQRSATWIDGSGEVEHCCNECRKEHAQELEAA